MLYTRRQYQVNKRCHPDMGSWGNMITIWKVGLTSLQKQNVQQMRKSSQITTFNSKLKNNAQ